MLPKMALWTAIFVTTLNPEDKDNRNNISIHVLVGYLMMESERTIQRD